MAGQAVNTGMMYGPTREDFERNKRENPVSTDTGVEHGPTRYDYDKKKEAEKIERNRQKVEDIQSRDYWKQQKKDADAAERKREKEEAERERQKSKKKRSWLGNRKPGIEVPKQGLHRLGYASRDLGGPITHASPMEFGGYGDAFSMGGAESGLALSLGNKRGRGVDFGSMSVEFGRLGGAMTQDGRARGFGGYRDPFGRAAPAQKGKRKRRKSTGGSKSRRTGKNKSSSRGRGSGSGRVSGIGSFRLGLF